MRDLAPFWSLLKWGALVAASPVIATLPYRAIRAIYDDLYKRVRQWQHDALTVSHIKTQNKLHAVRHLPPDENGRHGIVFDGQVYHNMDSGEVFTQLATLYLDPMRVQLDAIQRTLIAMRGVQGGNVDKAQQLTEQAPVAIHWPERVYLDELLDRYHIVPAVDNLLLGITYDENGREQPVTGDMEGMAMGSELPHDVDTSSTRMTEQGTYQVSIDSNLDPVAINQIHTWNLHVETPEGQPVESADITVGGGMPQHNHGFPTSPQVTKNLGGGDYLVEGVKFNMAGWWEMSFDITGDGQTDSVTFNVVLE